MSPTVDPFVARDGDRPSAPGGLAPARHRGGRSSHPGDPERICGGRRWRPAWKPWGDWPADPNATARSWPDTQGCGRGHHADRECGPPAGATHARSAIDGSAPTGDTMAISPAFSPHGQRAANNRRHSCSWRPSRHAIAENPANSSAVPKRGQRNRDGPTRSTPNNTNLADTNFCEPHPGRRGTSRHTNGPP